MSSIQSVSLYFLTSAVLAITGWAFPGPPEAPAPTFPSLFLPTNFSRVRDTPFLSQWILIHTLTPRICAGQAHNLLIFTFSKGSTKNAKLLFA